MPGNTQSFWKAVKFANGKNTVNLPKSCFWKLTQWLIKKELMHVSLTVDNKHSAPN
jgi:hypothetical protein